MTPHGTDDAVDNEVHPDSGYGYSTRNSVNSGGVPPAAADPYGVDGAQYTQQGVAVAGTSTTAAPLGAAAVVPRGTAPVATNAPLASCRSNTDCGTQQFCDYANSNAMCTPCTRFLTGASCGSSGLSRQGVSDCRMVCF